MGRLAMETRRARSAVLPVRLGDTAGSEHILCVHVVCGHCPLMSNVTLAIDDDLLAAARRYAQDHGTTLNALVRKILEQTVQPRVDSWFDEFERVADESRGSSRGRRWNRDELHERHPAIDRGARRTVRR
jgi:hypothetical protein